MKNQQDNLISGDDSGNNRVPEFGRLTFPNLMRQLREHYGLTQDELAAKLTLGGYPTDRTQLSHIERGTRKSNPELLIALTIAYELSSEDEQFLVESYLRDAELNFLNEYHTTKKIYQNRLKNE